MQSVGGWRLAYGWLGQHEEALAVWRLVVLVVSNQTRHLALHVERRRHGVLDAVLCNVLLDRLDPLVALLDRRRLDLVVATRGRHDKLALLGAGWHLRLGAVENDNSLGFDLL